MTALKAKWSEMSRYRRVLLLVMAAEILVFFIANVLAFLRPGLEYQDTLLYPRTEGELQIYQGRVDGETAPVHRHAGWGGSPTSGGEYTYGPYQISEDPSAVPDGYEGSQGMEIRLGDEVLFRGCYLPSSTFPLIQEDGESLWGGQQYLYDFRGEDLERNGQEITEREYREPSLSALARVALGTELTRQGNILLYLLITVLAVFNVLQICFPGLFFRRYIRWRVRDPELAEPSDFYIAMERMEWVVLAIVCLVLYGMCLTTITHNLPALRGGQN